MDDIKILVAVALTLIVMIGMYSVFIIRSNQRTIARQQDTINRLISHEPVTYAEVGTKPQKVARERYAAWGAQMVDMDEEENA